VRVRAKLHLVLHSASRCLHVDIACPVRELVQQLVMLLPRDAMASPGLLQLSTLTGYR
jgi:hypothetical protein